MWARPQKLTSHAFRIPEVGMSATTLFSFFKRKCTYSQITCLYCTYSTCMLLWCTWKETLSISSYPGSSPFAFAQYLPVASQELKAGYTKNIHNLPNWTTKVASLWDVIKRCGCVVSWQRPNLVRQRNLVGYCLTRIITSFSVCRV